MIRITVLFSFTPSSYCQPPTPSRKIVPSGRLMRPQRCVGKLRENYLHMCIALVKYQENTWVVAEICYHITLLFLVKKFSYLLSLIFILFSKYY